MIEIEKMKMFKIKDLQTNKISNWSIEKIVNEINRDRSEGWEDYDESDWYEGWNLWVEGEFYSLYLNKEVKENE